MFFLVPEKEKKKVKIPDISICDSHNKQILIIKFVSLNIFKAKRNLFIQNLFVSYTSYVFLIFFYDTNN